MGVLPAGATVMIDGEQLALHDLPANFSGGANDPGVTCGQQHGPFTVGANNVSLVGPRRPGATAP
jgi:hypothetical protein